MELQEKLKEEAIKLGLCEQWQKEWGNPTHTELMDKFVRGQDFCIKHDWPKVDFIKENFTPQELKENGIFIENGDCHDKRYIVILGEADVTVDVFSPCDITVRHNATVHVRAHNHLCYVSLYDNATVVVESKEPNALVNISYYGGTIRGKEYIDKINNKTK